MRLNTMKRPYNEIISEIGGLNGSCCGNNPCLLLEQMGWRYQADIARRPLKGPIHIYMHRLARQQARKATLISCALRLTGLSNKR
jgi:hypothetical protein